MKQRRSLSFVLICCISSIFSLFPHNLVAQTSLQERKDSALLNFSEASALSEVFFRQKFQDSLRLKHYLSQHSLRKKWVGKGQNLVEFQRIGPRGTPIYFVQTNERAAKTISAHALKPGGRSGLGLTGKGIEIGVWDGGIIFHEHEFFQNRVENVNTGEISAHTTHVSGTLAGNSQNDIYDGLALEASLKGYVWDDLEGEILAAAGEGMLLSNHSWTVLSGWNYDVTRQKWVWGGAIDQTEDYKFGYYSQYTQSLDAVAYTSPYHLMVRSAGNDRSEKGPQAGESYYIQEELYTEPREVDGGEDGYDCIPSIGTGKNILTVGAIFDIPDGYQQPSDAVMMDFSGWGPADDGRIKPDVVASGSSVFSAYFNSLQPERKNLIAGLTGTSMAAPAVTGSLALLQEQYKQLTGGTPLRAASLKALLIHTADEAGPDEGPDYQFGWGVVNALQAAITLDEASKGTRAKFYETNLAEGDSFLQYIYAPGEKSLHATLSWTDPAGVPISEPSALLNNRSPMLVHDLDLRLIHLPTGDIFLPYALDPTQPDAPAKTTDNRVDNVEKIAISLPQAGVYALVVSHKDRLSTPKQEFSLFVSGIDRHPVNEADKQALLSIYEATGGDNWKNSWNLEEEPHQWHGVTIDNFGRVSSLDLSENNLQGEFPNVQLSLLDSLNVAGNELTGFLGSLLASQLDFLNVSENALTFTDLLPLQEGTQGKFLYSPQDSLIWIGNLQQRFGDSIVLNIYVDTQLTDLTYHWYKNDSLLESTESNSLSFNYLTYSDSGHYQVRVSHPSFEDLLLQSTRIKLGVAPPICDLTHNAQVQAATCGENNGRIGIELSGGRLPYQLQWNTGDSLSTLEGLGPGVYSLLWIDRNLCTDSLSFEIEALPEPNIRLRQVSSSICGENNGSASLEIDGSTGPFSIFWSNGSQSTFTDSLSPGKVSVAVIDTNRCVVIDSLEISDVRAPSIQTLNLIEAHCGRAEGQIEIEIQGDSPPFELQWENGYRGKRLENLLPGMYKLAVSDSLGCVDSLSIELMGSDSLAVDTVIVSDARCGEINGQAEIRVQGGKPPYTFIWNGEEKGEMGTRGMLAPGPYHVRVKGQTGCEDSARFSLLELGSKPQAAFTFSRVGLTYFFTNLSLQAERFLWDFGDGNMSTEAEPQHTYATDTNYVVSLVATNSLCGSDSLRQFLLTSSFATTQKTVVSEYLHVYPSPALEKLYIDLRKIPLKKALDIKLIDLLGHTISHFEIIPGDDYFISIPVNNFPSGIYTVLVQLDSQIVSRGVKIGK